MTGIADVARAASVTVGTVSRVLNEDPTVVVRPETRERILAAARSLNYTPNHAARSLRQARVGAIGLALHDVGNPIFAPLIRGAQLAASEAGFALVLANAPELTEDPTAFNKLARSGLIDGLLLLPDGVPEDRQLAQSLAGVLPTAILNDTSTYVSSVTLDDAHGMALATEHLIGLGHRDIGLLHIDGDSERASSRFQGWSSAMKRARIDTRDSWVLDGGHTIESGRRAALDLFSQEERPTGLVVANVIAAIGALAAARVSNLRVPHDLSIVAFHDVAFADQLDPALTVVAMPLEKLAIEGVAVLQRLLAGGEMVNTMVDSPAPLLLQRASTSSPRPDVP